jgi:rhodanese-related sulfurtransferase
MHTYLTQKGLKQVDEEEALALQRKGHVIVDVRLASDFKVGGGATSGQQIGCSQLMQSMWEGERARSRACCSQIYRLAGSAQHAVQVPAGLPPLPLLPLNAPARPPAAAQIEHIEGAINVPMFRETAGTSGWDRVKRVSRHLCACAGLWSRGATLVACQPAVGPPCCERVDPSWHTHANCRL